MPVTGMRRGGSAIIAPGGMYLVEPVYDEETIIMAEINLADISVHKWVFRWYWALLASRCVPTALGQAAQAGGRCDRPSDPGSKG